MNSTALIRPAWTPATIALSVVGFMVYWPLGLAMIAYIIWGDRLEGFKRDANRMTDGAFGLFKKGARSAGRTTGATGNVAFDDWRKAELDRLADERRKLDDMYQEFDAYAQELRRAKDQDEFDRFMSARNKRTAPARVKKGETLLDD